MTKASLTAFERPSSIVNLSWSQSQEHPIFSSWLLMMLWCLSFTAQVRSKNFSLPRSWRLKPSFASCLSTTFCVAIPAWSVPGTQRVGTPVILLYLMIISCRLLFKAWPMWRTPVTFGGGMTTVKCPSPLLGANSPFSFHSL